VGFNFGDVWKRKYVVYDTRETEIHKGSECAEVLGFAQNTLQSPLNKGQYPKRLDGSPSTVSQPFGLATERPLRLLHIHHNALVQTCQRIPRPSSVKLPPSLVVPPAIRRSSEHNEYQEKHTHNTLLIPSCSYCLQGICCLKKPFLGADRAPSRSAESPATRV
jgi:hypothetical protein